MPRRRFYAAPENFNGSIVWLSSQETHHLTHVLRMTPGDEAFVFDGCGREYTCRFKRVEGQSAELEITATLSDVVESPLELTLAQSLAKGEKFDFIVQKATELGVNRIVPLITRYADVRLDDQQKISRAERWRRISLEATKQCGRRRLVDISEPLSIYQFMSVVNVASTRPEALASALLVFNEKGGAPLSRALKDIEQREVVALVGPEGGWSDDELEALTDSGCKSITLGPRVMRTETAALVAITLIQHTLGDISTHID